MPDTKKKSTAAKTTSGAKKKTAAKAADAKSAAAKKTAAKAKAEAAAKSAPVREVNPDSIANQIIPYLLVIAALFIAVCFLMTGATGVIGGFLRSTLYGLFAGGACAVPLFILVAAFFWKKDTIEGIRRWKLLFAFICLVLISVLLHVFTGGGDSLVAKALWENGQHFLGGGVIGGVIGGLLLRGFGKAGTLIIGITALVVFMLFLFGLTPHTLRIYIQYYFHKKREENAARREAEASSPKQKPKVFREPPVIPQEENTSQTHGKFNTNVALENEKPPIDDNPYNIDDTPSQLAPESAPTEEEEASQSGREDTIVDEGVFDEVIRSMNDSLGVEESKESEPVELPEDLEVDIRPEDIEMQVYRSSGAGVQHVNKTSSAVRLIHIPTGIVTACQTQRSQFQNREYAMQMLKSKLMELKIQQHAEKISDLKGVQMKIEWGSQIRSYVFMPYTLAKDTRTGYEMGNIQAVMDGDIDGFINAYLTASATGELKK